MSKRNTPNVETMASISGCRISQLPMKYHNHSLGSPFKSKSTWDDILEKIEMKLDSWKIMHLSKVGRVTLIKSTVSNLPTYFLSPPRWPIAWRNCNAISKKWGWMKSLNSTCWNGLQFALPLKNEVWDLGLEIFQQSFVWKMVMEISPWTGALVKNLHCIDVWGPMGRVVF